MIKRTLVKSAFSLLMAVLAVIACDAKETWKFTGLKNFGLSNRRIQLADTIVPKDVMDVITTVIYSLNTFNIDAVANLYTPNAVVADDEPPYSWNGPTAGIQWVNAIEKVCKDNKLTKLKGTIGAVNVFQQSAANVYIIVPVTYTGDLPKKTNFLADGAFAFVLRMANGKWVIKSQAWIARRGI